MGPHWPQDEPYGIPTVIWRHNGNFSFLRKIDDQKFEWPRGSQNFEFWGMVIFTVLTHFLDPMGPHWPQDGP